MVKEQFRDKIPTGRIHIQIQDKGAPIQYWTTTAEVLFAQIDAIVDYYMEIGIKLTNRQLYYQLVGKDLVPNKDKVYKRVCSFITDERYAGKIDWDAIEDRDRIPEKHADWDDVSDLMDSAISSYRLPRWKDQHNYVEIYCEKKAGVSVLQPIANKYHVYFGFNKGYSSASAMYDLANRVRDKIVAGKRAVILYFGDHDPSGLDMVRDIKDRITEFLTGGEYALAYEDVEDQFEVINSSLTKEQITKYNLPPNPAKLTDPRAKWYIEQHGNKSWELDAVDALELRKIATTAVEHYLDMDKYNAWIKKEWTHKKQLKNYAATLDGDE